MATRDHEISPGALDRFAAGRARPAERRKIALHLFAGCPVCQQRLRAAGFPAAPAPTPEAYDAAFAAAAEEVARELPRTQPPTALLTELDGVPPERRELKVRNQPRFASLPLVEALVEQSHALRYQDPEGMFRQARLAVAVAESITHHAPPRLVHDARALAWGHVGNAHRVRSEFPEARSAFGKAFADLELGSGDPALRARLSRCLASLCYEVRDFGKATALLTEAVAISRRLRDRSGEAMALMQLGIVAIIAGSPEAALAPLRLSFRMLDRPQDETLQRAALQNLVRCWIDLGRPDRAYTLCVDAEPLLAGCTDTTMALHWEWHRGLIDRDLGLLDAAETRLRRAREGFLKLNFSQEVAVVLLDLASVYLRAGKVPQALQALSDAIPVFQALGIQRDLLAALLELRRIAHHSERALVILQKLTVSVRDAVPAAEPGRHRRRSAPPLP
ncbi:MAG TPA: tetratricopeptide repeat protein [Thermoanaerobaculia bacterium]|nr:tetratricopeptide repeat protein [Thermoanaerobaculia bacterium]